MGLDQLALGLFVEEVMTDIDVLSSFVGAILRAMTVAPALSIATGIGTRAVRSRRMSSLFGQCACTVALLAAIYSSDNVLVTKVLIVPVRHDTGILPRGTKMLNVERRVSWKPANDASDCALIRISGGDRCVSSVGGGVPLAYVS